MLNKLFLIITTGLPGIHKLIFFFFIESYLGVFTLGEFSNDYYIIQFFIIFNALGLSSLLMVNLPKKNALDEIKNYSSIINVTMLFGLLISFPLIVLLYETNILYTIFDAYLLLVGMSGNLIVRHYFLALKMYKHIFIFDLLVLLFFLLVFTITYFLEVKISILELVAIIYLGSYISFLTYYKMKVLRNIIPKKEIYLALNVGLVNAFSAGVYFVLIPLVNKKLGVEYAGLIGIIFTISSLLVLIPRAMSMYFLPDISKNILDYKSTEKIYTRYKYINIFSLFSLFIVSLLLLFSFNYYFLDRLFQLKDANIIYILFMSSVLISQLSLAPSNLLIAFEKAEVLRNIGFKLLIWYLFIYVVLEILDVQHFIFVYLFISSMLLANLYRFYILNKIVKRIFLENKKGIGIE